MGTTDSRPRTALESVARRGFLLGSWPWRSLGYLLTGLPVAFVAALAVAALGWPLFHAVERLVDGAPAAEVAGFAVLGIVLPALALPLVAIPVAAVERLRLRMVDRRPTWRVRQPDTGRLRARYTEAASWREVGYTWLLALAVPVLYGSFVVLSLFVAGLVISPLLVVGDPGPVSVGFGEVTTVGEALTYAVPGALLLLVLPYPLALAAGAHASVARALLHSGGNERLHAELVEVTRSRARLVDAFEAERRRIEADLHDGAQQRLVALTLQLGLAQLDLPPGSPAADAVTSAHHHAKELMVELRSLIRGIHPQVLSDRGLPAALSELADRCPVPVTVSCALTDRLPAHLETTAYFVVSEALTNVAKHSGATSAAVAAHLEGDDLVVEIRDDGRGGAEPGLGTGLVGLTDRVAAIDGRMLVSSRPGGPTLIRVELPCGPSE